MARGSDGNYFLAALLPGLLLAANATLSRVRGVARTAVLACIPAFALFQAAYAFASAGWATGTRAFDFDLARNWHDSRAVRWPTLRLAGMEKIGRHLKELRASTLTVGYATEPASFWLPTRFENLLAISYSRPEFVETEAGLEGFLRDQHIEGLVLPPPAVARRNTPTCRSPSPPWRRASSASPASCASTTAITTCSISALGAHGEPPRLAGSPLEHATQEATRGGADARARQPGEVDRGRDDEPERHGRAEGASSAQCRNESDRDQAREQPAGEPWDRAASGPGRMRDGLCAGGGGR